MSAPSEFLEMPATAVDVGEQPAELPASTDVMSAAVVEAVDESAGTIGSGPLGLVDSPLLMALTEFARRQVSAGSNATASQVTSSETVSKGGLVVAPTVAFDDGIFFGDLNATSTRGAALSYTSLGGTNGGKLSLGTGPSVDAADPDQQNFTALPYATWLDGATKGTEQFSVRVSEVTGFDRIVTSIPLVGLIAAPIIDLLQQLPLISSVLAPLIGASVVAAIDVRVGEAASGSTPVAFTYDVTSFDGTKISTNFFPAVGLEAGSTAETVLNGPGLAQPGQTDPYAEWGITDETAGVGTLRQTGYNVVTWDPRGEFASGGLLQLDNPFYEGRDVSALIDFVAAETPAVLDGAGDPATGMVGGSYGGGIQLTAASIDPRVDVIVPDISWNSFNESIYPSQIFRTAYSSLLALSLVSSGARVNPLLYSGLLTGVLFGRISETAQAALASNGPTVLLNKLTAPTMLTQGIVDVLLPLQQSLDNIETIIANPYLGTDDVRLTWFCGGHGVCANPLNPGQATTLKTNALAWLEKYLRGNGAAADAIPTFQWYDQLGGYHFSAELPSDAGFNNLPDISGTGAGGALGIIPLLGGSGPGAGTLPYSLGNGAPARNAINVDLVVPAGTQVVGAPHVSFAYQGLGNARAVYAQVVDDSTGQVLGNVVTPVPVTLDGRRHVAEIDLADIVYTYGGQTNPGQLTLQITSSATAFANSSIGFIKIADISATLPNRDPAL